VQTTNATGRSLYSNIANISTSCLGTPGALTATLLEDGTVLLSWVDANTGELGFHVERSTDGTDWAEIGTTGIGVPVFIDTTAQCDASFIYRVRAGNLDGYSQYSNTASIVLLCPPTGLSITDVFETAIHLSWTPHPAADVVTEIERSPDGTTWATVNTTASGVSTFDDTGLACDSSYSYRARAARSADSALSTYSDVVNTTSLACPTTTPTPEITPEITPTVTPEVTPTIASRETVEVSEQVLFDVMQAAPGSVPGVEAIDYVLPVLVAPTQDTLGGIRVVIRMADRTIGDAFVMIRDGGGFAIIEVMNILVDGAPTPTGFAVDVNRELPILVVHSLNALLGSYTDLESISVSEQGLSITVRR
jgi:hypothetical protein